MPLIHRPPSTPAPRAGAACAFTAAGAVRRPISGAVGAANARTICSCTVASGAQAIAGSSLSSRRSCASAVALHSTIAARGGSPCREAQGIKAGGSQERRAGGGITEVPARAASGTPVLQASLFLLCFFHLSAKGPTEGDSGMGAEHRGMWRGLDLTESCQCHPKCHAQVHKGGQPRP